MKGHELPLLLDMLGLLLAVVVISVALSDPAGAQLLFKWLGGACKKMRCIWVDGAYRRQLLEWVLLHYHVRMQPVLHPQGQKGLAVLPRRWVVERTFAWLAHCRRLANDAEALAESSEALMYIVMTRFDGPTARYHLTFLTGSYRSTALSL